MNSTTRQRIVVITGANSGIGKAAAARFASAGDHVVMAVRDLRRSEPARLEIASRSPSASLELMEVDVSSFASIRRFAEAFAARHPRLDVLINNAGYFNHGIRTYQSSPDGVELTFATNAFGPLLLTERLLEPLARSGDARVLNAGSTNIKNFFNPARTIEFDNLRGEHRDSRPYSVYKMYGDSKAGLLMLTYRMAREYAARGIKVNCVMIPTVRVEKAALKKFRSWFRIVGPIVQYWNPLALPPARMADVYYRICTSEAFRQVTGAFIDHRGRVLTPSASGRPLPPMAVARELLNTRHAPPYVTDPENIERMWRVSQEVIRA